MLAQIQRRFGDLIADQFSGGGVLPGVTPWRLIGVNLNVYSAGLVWIDLSPLTSSALANVPEMSAAGTALEVLSSNAADTLLGAGVRTIIVEGLTATNAISSQTISMNGVTPVNLATNLSAVNFMYARSASSNSAGATGNITLRTQGGAGSNFSQILAGQNYATQALYKVPANRQLRITRATVSAGFDLDDSKIEVEIAAQAFLGTATLGPYITQARFALGSGSGAPGLHEFDTPVIVPAASFVKVRARIVTAPVVAPTVTMTVEGYLWTVPS